MPKKVIQQDIANALSLSRNTVSKAFNNSNDINERTKSLIFETAKKMGYKKSKEHSIIQNNDIKKSIALLTHRNNIYNSFWGPFLKGIEEPLRNEGYNITIHFINNNDEENCILPTNLESDTTSGIVTLGIFTKKYYTMLASTNIPLLFIDTYAQVFNAIILSDTLIMDSKWAVYELTEQLIKKGHSKIGFIGAIYSCRSYFERWLGFEEAMKNNNLVIDEKLLITPMNHSKDNEKYFGFDDFKEKLLNLKDYPTAFVCVNDSIAIDLIKFLNSINLRIPQDIAITGFDNIPESALVTPALTTAQCHRKEMGYRAAQQIILRIQNPNMPHVLIYSKTDILLRDTI